MVGHGQAKGRGKEMNYARSLLRDKLAARIHQIIDIFNIVF